MFKDRTFFRAPWAIPDYLVKLYGLFKYFNTQPTIYHNYPFFYNLINKYWKFWRLDAFVGKNVKIIEKKSFNLDTLFTYNLNRKIKMYIFPWVWSRPTFMWCLIYGTGLQGYNCGISRTL